MKNLKVVFLSFVFMSAYLISASVAWSQNLLQDVSAYSDDQGFIAELIFDGLVTAEDVEIEYINRTIQVNVKNAEYAKKKNLLRVKDPAVRSLYTYQPEPKMVRSRIIYNKPYLAKDFSSKVRTEINNGVIRVRVLKDEPVIAKKIDFKPESLDPSSEVPSEDVQSQKQLEEILEKELAARGLTDTTGEKTKPEQQDAKAKDNSKLVIAPDAEGKKAIVPISKANQIDEASVPLFQNRKAEAGSEKSNLWLRLIVSMAVLGVLALGLIFFSKWWKSRTVKNELNTSMRVVSQFHIGPKKSLMVVRVAGEFLLLGVTEDNISMIKTLSLLEDDLSPSFNQSFRDVLEAPQEDEMSDLIEQVKDQTRLAAAHSQENVSSSAEAGYQSYSVRDMVASKLKEMRSL